MGMPGIIQTPGYMADNYPNNIQCSWVLAPSETDEITFTYFKPSDLFNLDDTSVGFEDTLDVS